MRIAVLVDGLESTRQYHADDGRSILEASAKLTAIGKPVSVSIIRDRESSATLATLPQSPYDALVIASNAIRHADGYVARAVREHAEQVTSFLDQGRGLILLHQYTTADTQITTPDGTALQFARRRDEAARPRITAQDSPVVNYPFPVDLTAELSATGQLGQLGSWLSVPESVLPEFDPVIESGTGETLLAVSAAHLRWRVVASALPLDWHEATGLLANCIEYACVGSPELVIWPSGDGTALGTALGHLRTAHRIRTADPAAGWLRTRRVLHVVSPSDAADTGSYREATRGGALLLATDQTGEAGTVRLTGQVGARQYVLARDFFAADPASVVRHGRLDPFPTRNVVVAARYFCENVAESGTERWDPRHDRELRARLGSLFYDGMTLSSVLAVIQVLCAADAPRPMVEDALARARLLSPGDALSDVLLAACEAASGDGTVQSFADGLEGLDLDELSAPDLLRVLDWVGCLVLVLKLDSATPDLRSQTARLVSALARFGDDDVWLSHEGTATVALAIAAVAVAPSDLRPAARAVAVLRSEYETTMASGTNVSAAARYGHALAAVEELAPFVLDTLLAATAGAARHPSAAAPVEDHRPAAALAARNRSLTAALEQERNNLSRLTPVFVVGAVVCWLAALAVVGAGASVLVLLWRWPDIAQLTTVPGVLGWLLLVGGVAWLLDRMGILPQRLGALGSRLRAGVRRRLRG